MPQVKPEIETFAKIKVVGVGGSGGAAIDRMVKAGIRGVDFIAMNTDVQALHHNSAAHKLHIGKTITRGLGAGMDPELGKRSAEESQNEIREMMKDTDMVFLTCGLGGGTGSGASPIVAEIAREAGALTVAVVTKPFTFEGPQRKAIADKAHEDLSRSVDTIITIPNDRVLQIIDKKTSLLEAFKIVDDVLRHGVQGISEIITVPGLINVDFADVRAIMRDTGSALMGIGLGSGENRAVEAAKAAISSPLLEISIDGARGILFTITGGTNLGMQEVAEAAKVVTSSADDDAKVIFGAVIDESMGEDIRITVVATGFESRDRRSLKSGDDETRKASFGVNRSFYGGLGLGKKTPQASSVIDNDKEIRNDEFSVDFQDRPKRPVFTSKSVFGGDDTVVKSSTIFPKSVEEKPTRPAISKSDKTDDDLEIPAFIRRKMGM